MRHRSPFRLAPALVVAILIGAIPRAAAAQETVQTAQALYAAAAYDEALAVLDRLQQQGTATADPRILNQQRALCLLALGRDQEAELAIAAAVQADPTFRPSEDAVSPRVRSAFRDVRSRLLPSIVQSQYMEARRLYDAQSWKEAEAAFRLVLTLSADPDLDAAGAESLSDIKVLAADFAELAEKAAAPPPPPPAPEPDPEPAPPPAPVIDYDRIYEATEQSVIAPVTIRQQVPRWDHSTVPPPSVEGTLELIIAKDGTVERASLPRPLSPLYDHKLLDSTKFWRYRPAQFNGQPVRFRKVIRIAFE